MLKDTGYLTHIMVGLATGAVLAVFIADIINFIAK